MIGKVTSLATRFIGPKVITGALITLTIGCATLTHLWQSALSDKANAEIQAETYMTALANTENELERERIQRRALSNAIEERMAREQAARARARAAEARLAELEANNDEVSHWSNTPVPDDLRDWLHDDTQPSRQD
jgi:hypothetical protein